MSANQVTAPAAGAARYTQESKVGVDFVLRPKNSLSWMMTPRILHAWGGDGNMDPVSRKWTWGWDLGIGL